MKALLSFWLLCITAIVLAIPLFIVHQLAKDKRYMIWRSDENIRIDSSYRENPVIWHEEVIKPYIGMPAVYQNANPQGAWYNKELTGQLVTTPIWNKDTKGNISSVKLRNTNWSVTSTTTIDGKKYIIKLGVGTYSLKAIRAYIAQNIYPVCEKEKIHCSVLVDGAGSAKTVLTK